jgi:MFS transporter, PHS family, inorganic phosphate transporter
VGQLLFGFLADKIGRQRLYGAELVIVIFATLGLAQSSYGYVTNSDGELEKSMSLVGWLAVWRFFMGIGIGGSQDFANHQDIELIIKLGAEYPLSAIITAE